MGRSRGDLKDGVAQPMRERFSGQFLGGVPTKPPVSSDIRAVPTTGDINLPLIRCGPSATRAVPAAHALRATGKGQARVVALALRDQLSL
jgi:hypothetical protein